MRKLHTLLALVALIAASNAQATIFTLEPDDFDTGVDLSHVNPLVTLQTFRSYSNTEYTPTFAPIFVSQCVDAGPWCHSTTGLRSFGDAYAGYESWGAFGGSSFDATECFRYLSLGTPGASCSQSFNMMLITFAEPTDFVEIQGAFWAEDATELYGFDDGFNPVGTLSLTVDWLRCRGETAYSSYCLATSSLTSATGGIRYVLAGGLSNGTSLDNLRFRSVPEPGTLALLAVGLLGIVFARRRKLASVLLRDQ